MPDNERKYRYLIWCKDCEGDRHGCFDGCPELSEEIFDTPELAKAAAEVLTGEVSPWEYCITDEDGIEIAERVEEGNA
jgi:hypothetical protein